MRRLFFFLVPGLPPWNVVLGRLLPAAASERWECGGLVLGPVRAGAREEARPRAGALRRGRKGNEAGGSLPGPDVPGREPRDEGVPSMFGSLEVKVLYPT